MRRILSTILGITIGVILAVFLLLLFIPGYRRLLLSPSSPFAHCKHMPGSLTILFSTSADQEYKQHVFELLRVKPPLSLNAHTFTLYGYDETSISAVRSLPYVLNAV